MFLVWYRYRRKARYVVPIGGLQVLRPNPKNNMVYGTLAGVDYNLTLCPLQSRLQHIYNGQPYARLDLTLCQSQLYPPTRDFGFGLFGNLDVTLIPEQE